MAELLHDLLLADAHRRGDAPCLGQRGEYRDYAATAGAVEAFAGGLVGLDLGL